MEAIASDEDVKQFKYMTDLSEVMDKSGCDVPLTVSVFFLVFGILRAGD